MRPGVHHLMNLLLFGGMLAFVAYIRGKNVRKAERKPKARKH